MTGVGNIASQATIVLPESALNGRAPDADIESGMAGTGFTRLQLPAHMGSPPGN
jgi:hypothetical protein